MQLTASCRQSNPNLTRELTAAETQSLEKKRKENGTLDGSKKKGKKKKGGKKLRLFHKKRAKTSGVKIFTSSTLGAALQRVEPDNPEHPAHEQPSWQQHAHGPRRQAGAPPQALAGPPSRRPRWDSCGRKEQIPRAGSNRARRTEELRRIRDGRRGRNWI